MEDIETSARTSDDIRHAAVKLVNEGGFSLATVPRISAAAGLTEEQFAEHYPSVPAVFAAIAEALVADHQLTIGATLVRRRSLTESVKLALLASWELIETRIDEHQATKYVTFVGLTAPGAGVATRALYESFLDAAENQLLELERIHGIAWELPTRQLARLLLVTIDGLVLSYLNRRDSAAVRVLLELLAYHLAQHGRRVAKNRRP